MNNRLQSVSGIVLSSVNAGEADKRVTLFTKEKGKITVLAKGVRRPTSRKRSALEVFNVVKAYVKDVDNFGLVTEVELLGASTEIRAELKKISVAYYMCECISKVLPYGQPHPEVFVVLHRSLKALGKTKNLKGLRLQFARDVLSLLGYINEDENIPDIDTYFEGIVERKLGSLRIGKVIQ